LPHGIGSQSERTDGALETVGLLVDPALNTFVGAADSADMMKSLIQFLHSGIIKRSASLGVHAFFLVPFVDRLVDDDLFSFEPGVP
jgi:hypothetical protein